jgi:hypothetical protein
MKEGASILLIDSEELKVESTRDDEISVRFVGSADTRSIPAIEDLLRRLHERAIELAVAEVVVDFRALHFINSSCLKSFVVWLGRIQELEPAEHYRIRFFADESKPWQRRSLGALGCFAVDLVRIETKAAGVGA